MKDNPVVSPELTLVMTGVLVLITLVSVGWGYSMLPYGLGQGAMILLVPACGWFFAGFLAVGAGFRATQSGSRNALLAYLILMIIMAIGTLAFSLADSAGLVNSLTCAAPGLIGVMLAILRFGSRSRKTDSPGTS